jgi:hypothetical protein
MPKTLRRSSKAQVSSCGTTSTRLGRDEPDIQGNSTDAGIGWSHRRYGNGGACEGAWTDGLW